METDVPAVAIPVYMIMGERDFWLVQARRYFDRLEAPEKKMFVIHDAGHIVRGDKPEEVEKILFSVIGSTAR
ncbi:MAG: alpha/beta hydrolase [Chitinispirillaceae bacterium]|nr:alpha/beta hydrolase [Chitinispirillaceae bacterium]